MDDIPLEIYMNTKQKKVNSMKIKLSFDFVDLFQLEICTFYYA